MNAIDTTITATLSAVARMASLIMKEEKVPFCFSRKRRAMKNGRFKNIPVAIGTNVKRKRAKGDDDKIKVAGTWVVRFSQCDM
jgi:hypothetical protein